MPVAQPPSHSVAEDALAIVIGTLFVSFGIMLFKQAGLLTGSTAGVAFLVYYLTAIPFGLAFFVINVPFYYFAFRRMGWRFTAKSFVSVALVSVFAEGHRWFIHIAQIDVVYAAIFGGFLMGVCMPRGLFVEELKRKVEPIAVVMLLPMFFSYSGLNTRMDMVNSPELLLIAAGVLIVSVLAKFGACYLAARVSGEDNRTALGIGALMNSRGLMELIIINIGLQKGIIGPTLFSMLVLMAIVTTVMASPLFELVYGKKARESGELEMLSGR